MTSRAPRIATLMFMLGLVRPVLAQDASSVASAEARAGQEPRGTGLPARLDWTFNLDAGFGSFAFFNSLYTNPHDEPSGDLSDNWQEGYVKPALSGVFRLSGGSTIAGRASAVGERTYGGAPALVGEDFSSFGPDDLWIAWRSGTALPRLGDDGVSLTVGRAPYQLGHGFLVYDGTGEGGSRGGYWSNARKAFQFAAIGRVKTGMHVAETFYLDKDELPEVETGSRLWGVNYELHATESSTFGVTYLKAFAHRDVDPGRDGLNVFNLRAFTTPIPRLEQWSLEFEYAGEHNGDARSSHAWSLQNAYAFASVPWTPKLSYRYASFEGDDPGTAADEAFDPLFLGFSDWGTWWQGEIAGEYFLSNSNLISHQVRVHATPTPRLGCGLIVYRFLADQPASYVPGLTARNIGVEVNAYADWAINDNFTLSLVGGGADPGEVVRQVSGRTTNFVLGTLYLAYKY
jgi:hypothetical protein